VARRACRWGGASVDEAPPRRRRRGRPARAAAKCRAANPAPSVIHGGMEIFLAIMGPFVVFLLAYAAAQLKVGLRDLSHAFALGLAARRGGASAGPVLLRGRVRGDRLLSPPAGGERVIAWSARGAY